MLRKQQLSIGKKKIIILSGCDRQTHLPNCSCNMPIRGTLSSFSWGSNAARSVETEGDKSRDKEEDAREEQRPRKAKAIWSLRMSVTTAARVRGGHDDREWRETGNVLHVPAASSRHNNHPGLQNSKLRRVHDKEEKRNETREKGVHYIPSHKHENSPILVPQITCGNRFLIFPITCMWCKEFECVYVWHLSAYLLSIRSLGTTVVAWCSHRMWELATFSSPPCLNLLCCLSLYTKTRRVCASVELPSLLYNFWAVSYVPLYAAEACVRWKTLLGCERSFRSRFVFRCEQSGQTTYHTQMSTYGSNRNNRSLLGIPDSRGETAQRLAQLHSEQLVERGTHTRTCAHTHTYIYTYMPHTPHTRAHMCTCTRTLRHCLSSPDNEKRIAELANTTRLLKGLSNDIESSIATRDLAIDAVVCRRANKRKRRAERRQKKELQGESCVTGATREPHLQSSQTLSTIPGNWDEWSTRRIAWCYAETHKSQSTRQQQTASVHSWFYCVCVYYVVFLYLSRFLLLFSLPRTCSTGTGCVTTRATRNVTIVQ